MYANFLLLIPPVHPHELEDHRKNCFGPHLQLSPASSLYLADDVFARLMTLRAGINADFWCFSPAEQ
jgi:hypothetical protein